ncbi:Putative GTP cyclohydrolase 1 type 2 [Paraliobacillus sp. PM-2]|uniref:Nif3-like dinuclear metal center hexameric protein n=1 Tax=Paraliobacillus sp. PM-2 TaxID=1462524 RepID=UPI00061CBFB1|nr:Nif3-like dinuclear metal center hexameric protein [Paraliobacillus sp. PM-2]CQR46868.1 Putative GTP cyclohydrolase 1 type 2 [Paraliobacillus sp. PM-2]
MTKSIVAKDIIRMIEEWAPKELAYDWDNVGLQIGSLHKKVNNVMVTLDVLENVVDEAIEKRIDLIIAHHPLLFNALKQINIESAKGRTIEKLIKHDITVYAAHTNLDIAFGGVSDMLAHRLDIKNTKVLVPSGQERLMKLVTYVPEQDLEQVKKALGDNGAGYIGNYSHCTFTQKGTGSFVPKEGTNPYIGTLGEEEKVKEVKLETIIPSSKKDFFIKVLLAAHPYEEPAYDLIALDNPGEIIGIGRIGCLNQPMEMSDFCKLIKEKLKVSGLRVVGNVDKKVEKVAVLGGSGEDFISHAKRKGADVYITGDLTFHEAQEAWEMGLTVIDPGHHVEKVMIESVITYLEEKKLPIKLIASESNTEPFKFI